MLSAPQGGLCQVTQRLIRENQSDISEIIFRASLLRTIKTSLILVVPARRPSQEISLVMSSLC